jgi:acetyl esterase/lipase
MAPLLLIHGTSERLHAQGVAMAKRLADSHTPYDFYEVLNAPHGIENWEGHPEWMEYKTKLIEWLKANLAPRK